MGNLTCTASGTVANFYTPYAVPIRSFKVHFSPKQAGSGDPSPSNVRPIEGWTGVTGYRAGKNLLPTTGWTVGLAYRYFDTKLDTVARLTFVEKDPTIDLTGVVGIGFSYYKPTSSSEMNKGYCWIKNRSNSQINNYFTNKINQGTDSSVRDLPGRYIVVYPNTDEAFSVLFSKYDIQLEIGENPTPYEPYHLDEIPVSFPAVGKNLFDGVLANKSANSDGSDGNDNSRLSSDFIPISPGTYTVSFDSNFSCALYVFSSNQVGTQIAGESHIYWNTSPLTFTITNGKYYRIKFKHNTLNTISPNDLTDVQIELGSIPTEYEPYKGNTYYSGYVDLVSGELVQEWSRVDLGDLTWEILWNCFVCIPDGIETHSGLYSQVNLISDIFKTGIVASAGEFMNSTVAEGTMAGRNAYKHIGIKYRVSELSVEDFTEIVTGHKLCYKLATPITHTLSPQTLSTLVHDNAFWSNADSVEIEYDLAECGDIKEIRRRILLNTPHLETVSGSVAHFSTDMAAKLKECKVNFLPQQAGSGDPSPDNVRAISGWTGCDVVRSGKNIAQVIGYSATNVSSKTATRKLTNYYGTTLSTTDFSLPDTSVTITQSQWPKDTYHYENGYMCVVVDNIMFEKRYNVSFRITNITNNPLNVDISAIRLISLNSGSYRSVVIGDRLCFNNVLFSQMTSYPDKSEFEIRICGISFTLSEFMVTPAEDEDYTYAPYDPDKITVSWQDLWTIYGGFIDVLRGELVQEWGSIASYNGETLPGEWLSDRDVYAQGATPTTGAHVVYKLATAVTYSLTAEVIKSLKGINNIFSDANGDVNVKYYKH